MAITKLMSIKARTGGNKSAGLAGALKYIVNPEKTADGVYVGGNFVTPDWRMAYDQMVGTKAMFQKPEGRQGYHYVISFPPTEQVPPELAMEITRQFIGKLFGSEYEALYAVHTDQKHMHSHIVFNSVSRNDGHKYQYANGDWRKIIQPVTNEICKKYGLSTIDLSLNTYEGKLDSMIERGMIDQGRRLNHSEWEDEKHGYHTWAEFAAADIDEVLPDCQTFEDVVRALQEKGWEVKWKTKDGSRVLKHFAMRPPVDVRYQENNHAWLRPDVKCGYGYSREGLEVRIKTGYYNIEEKEMSDHHAPRVHRSTWPAEWSRPQLTDYQKKYIAYLYDTGKYNNMKANQIPMNRRPDVRRMKQLTEEVNYLIVHKIDTEQKLEARILGLQQALMRAEKAGDKDVIKQVKRELAVCEKCKKAGRSLVKEDVKGTQI